MDGLIGLVVLAALAIPALLVVALVMLLGLRARVSGLERQVADLRVMRAAAAPSMQSHMGSQAAPPPAAAPVSIPMPAAERDARDPSSMASAEMAPPASHVPGPPDPSSARAAASTSSPSPNRATFEVGRDPARAAAPSPQPPPLPPPLLREPPAPRTPAFVASLKRWFTDGNVPVKVGVLVLFAGVAALMKYASDAGWLRVPIELRLAGIALAAVAALVFGWRQRHARRAFALSVQGGAIGLLLLVVFASFKLYGLVPAPMAFALSVVLVAGTGVLAVRQDALALAVFGLLAGFLAPLWLSTGRGSHVALFGYYAVLNAGIVSIAWWRAWRVLNLLGFAFTFGIGTLWGVLAWRPEFAASVQPFLVVFFLIYLAIPLLNARAGRGRPTDAIDGTLVFGTPLVAFALQAGLLDGARMPVAFVALGLGVLCALLAAAAGTRAWATALRVPYAMLAIAFATLAVPLALSAQATACVFALEGAALCWLGLRQSRVLPQWAGTGLQLAAGVAFTVDAGRVVASPLLFANSRFAAALLVAVSGFATAHAYRRHARSGIALAFYAWALAWWLGAVLADIDRVLPHVQWAGALVALVATGALAGEAHARLGATRATAWTLAGALALGVPMALGLAGIDGSPLRDGGALAWAVFAVLGARMVHVLRDDPGMARIAHGAWWTALVLVAALALRHAAHALGLGSGWQWAAAAAPWLLVLCAMARIPARMAWPQAGAPATALQPLRALFAAVVAAGFALSLFDAGSSAPLPWLPLFNPLELAQLAALLMAAAVARLAHAHRHARPALAAAAFVAVTFATLRAMHHLGGAPWSPAMLDDGGVQAALSIVWSVLGVVAWVVGSRRGLRGLWLVGAVLMGVVLLKLLAVDRQHLGNLTGIVSFIAYGLLCAAVGYLAPAPPRHAIAEAP